MWGRSKFFVCLAVGAFLAGPGRAVLDDASSTDGTGHNPIALQEQLAHLFLSDRNLHLPEGYGDRFVLPNVNLGNLSERGLNTLSDDEIHALTSAQIQQMIHRQPVSIGELMKLDSVLSKVSEDQWKRVPRLTANLLFKTRKPFYDPWYLGCIPANNMPRLTLEDLRNLDAPVDTGVLGVSGAELVRRYIPAENLPALTDDQMGFLSHGIQNVIKGKLEAKREIELEEELGRLCAIELD